MDEQDSRVGILSDFAPERANDFSHNQSVRLALRRAEYLAVRGCSIIHSSLGLGDSVVVRLVLTGNKWSLNIKSISEIKRRNSNSRRFLFPSEAAGLIPGMYNNLINGLLNLCDCEIPCQLHPSFCASTLSAREPSSSWRHMIVNLKLLDMLCADVLSLAGRAPLLCSGRAFFISDKYTWCDSGHLSDLPPDLRSF